jgi:hypothetical protein
VVLGKAPAEQIVRNSFGLSCDRIARVGLPGFKEDLEWNRISGEGFSQDLD